MHSITRLVPRIAHSHTPTSTPIISPIIPANQEIVSLSPFYLLLPCPHLYLLQLPFLIFYSNKHQSNNDRWWIVIAYLPVTLQVLVSLSQNYCWLNDIALLCLNHLWTVSSTPKLTLLHPCKIVLHLVSMHQLINCCHISPSNFVGSYKFPQNYCHLKDLILLYPNHLQYVSSIPKLTFLHYCKLVLQQVTMIFFSLLASTIICMLLTKGWLFNQEP